jgi:hypothetical protein
VPIVHAMILVAAAHALVTQPIPARLQRVTVEIPDRDVLRVTLHAAPGPAMHSGLTGQKLRLGDVPVPLRTPVDVTIGHSETRVDFEVKLRAVPEGVLALDPNRMPVLWEGLDEGGTPVLAVGGTVDLGDPGEVELPLAGLYRAYAHLSDLSLTPSLAALSVHVLLSLYNPFGFDVVATGIDYRLAVGGQTVLAGKRPGFRLRGGQRSDVLIEQDLSLSDAVGGAAAFARGAPAQLQGTLTIRTLHGERPIPLLLRAGM